MKNSPRLSQKSEYPNKDELLADIIRQYLENNPGTLGGTVEKLSAIAQTLPRDSSDLAAYLSLAGPTFKRVNDEWNENANYHGMRNSTNLKTQNDPQQNVAQGLRKIASRTEIDQESISKAIDSIKAAATTYDSKARLLEMIRDRVTFSERPKYIQSIARLDNLDLNIKLRELEFCKENWIASSVALPEIYSNLGTFLVQIHSEDFVSFDSLHSWRLGQVSRLSDVPVHTLARELVTVFSTSSSGVSASVWMGLAAMICAKIKDGEGQSALERLLNSTAARLSSSVEDGEWRDQLYPTDSPTEIAASLIWFRLGSPSAVNRWRAAHCLKSLARYGRWEIIDAVISKIHLTDGGPFQARELSFYFLHARLWLLIAIARIAIDHPSRISNYEGLLGDIVRDSKAPHVLLRHFAANAVSVCAEHGFSALSARELKELKAIGASPFSLLKRKTHQDHHNSFYSSRPSEKPKSTPEFSLEYDFDKYDVSNLSELFDRPRWEVKDSLTQWVRSFDSKVSSMYETGGREARSERLIERMGDEYHLYGQQIGWHALFLAAGEFLSKYPVVSGPHDPEDSDPWQEWKSRNILTRADGLWLADGTDLPPIETKTNLLEKEVEGLGITGDKDKLLGLVGIRSSNFTELVVSGRWHSSDFVDVHVSTALANRKDARRLSQQLAKEDPFQMWLPQAEEGDEGGFHLKQKKSLEGWIVSPSKTARLDQHDPLCSSLAASRPRFSNKIIASESLQCLDPFGRFWLAADGTMVAHSETWRMETRRADKPADGIRFSCNADLLKRILPSVKSELLLLLILRRYENGSQDVGSKFFHTTAVIRITPSLSFEFYAGAVNQLHQSKI